MQREREANYFVDSRTRTTSGTWEGRGEKTGLAGVKKGLVEEKKWIFEEKKGSFDSSGPKKSQHKGRSQPDRVKKIKIKMIRTESNELVKDGSPRGVFKTRMNDSGSTDQLDNPTVANHLLKKKD